jgi:hypothetical protein
VKSISCVAVQAGGVAGFSGRNGACRGNLTGKQNLPFDKKSDPWQLFTKEISQWGVLPCPTAS